MNNLPNIPPTDIPPIACPLTHVPEITPCDSEELMPLILRLQENVVNQPKETFPRGTLVEDGRLDLCKQQVGASGARLITQALENNTIVTSLMLGTDGLGDSGAQSIAELINKNNTLTTIYLGCNVIRQAGVRALTEALKQNQQVKGLWLKRNPIGIEGATYIADMLRINQSIRTLDLVNTNIGLAGLRLIVRSLIEENRTVERLYLGGNQLGETAAQELATLLQENDHIIGLFLNVNHLSDQGAQQLAKGLAQNSTLQELGLASNHIGIDGVTALSEVIMKHPNLRGLDLGYSPSTKVLGEHANHLGDQGTVIISQLLKQNKTLITLNLTKTAITTTGVHTLLEGLENNWTLCKLILNCRLPLELKNHLKQLLARNQARIPETVMNPPSDIKAIKSVYRTKPRQQELE